MKSSDLHRLSDTDLINELRAYANQLALTPTAYGMVAADAISMNTAIDNFASDVTNVAANRSLLDGSLASRDSTRKIAEDMASEHFKIVRAKPGMTADVLALANLDAYETRTKAPAPGSVPVGIVDPAKLQHTIRFRDAANPSSAAKPKGVMGCEIWVKLDGTPPLDEKDCTFLALDTATPYVVNYPGADGGKTAHYLLRWISTRGEKGPWSEVVTATINA